MSSAALQAQLFQALKTKLGTGVSMPEEVARLLQISTHSAYRRIRGEKGLSLDELHTLCHHYHLSVDGLLQLDNGVVAFEGRYVQPPAFHYKDHLAAVAQKLLYLASAGPGNLYYLCKDIPLFYHYFSKPLAALHYFFWQKTILGWPGFDGKLRLADYPADVFDLGQTALQAYRQLNAVEIWNAETLNSILRQVEFYQDTAAFQHTDDLYQVYEDLEALIVHLEKQAESGYQSGGTDSSNHWQGRFLLYLNEIITGDNSILALADGGSFSLLAHSGINLMVTRDADFCNNLWHYYQNLMQKATLLSEVGERERGTFFHDLQKRIAVRKKRLKR